jgi:aldehyde dehydrogenase (NAD+)
MLTHSSLTDHNRPTPRRAWHERRNLRPVVGINTFKTEREAIAKAVDSEYGLYSAVYSSNINRALRVAKAMEAGTMGVNCTSLAMAHDMPFGGYKGSGQGREGFGYSIVNYLETKAVLIKLADDAEEGASGAGH